MTNEGPPERMTISILSTSLFALVLGLSASSVSVLLSLVWGLGLGVCGLGGIGGGVGGVSCSFGGAVS